MKIIFGGGNMPSKQKILLVEDSLGDALLARMEMQKMGYDADNVDHAISLEQAKTFLSLKQYDVIFLDYYVGTDIGTDLIPLIDTKRTNIILLSGYANIDDVKERFGNSILAATQKPLKYEKLEAMTMELKIEQEVKKKVRKMCIAAWSMVCSGVALLFGILTQYSETLKAMVKAGIEHLMSGAP